MFNMYELEIIDRKYFDVLQMDIYDVTLRSKNTGHYWRLHSPVMDSGECGIFHKHFRQNDFHKQCRAKSLRRAIKIIKDHDRYQIEVRGG